MFEIKQSRRLNPQAQLEKYISFCISCSRIQWSSSYYDSKHSKKYIHELQTKKEVFDKNVKYYKKQET